MKDALITFWDLLLGGMPQNLFLFAENCTHLPHYVHPIKTALLCNNDMAMITEHYNFDEERDRAHDKSTLIQPWRGYEAEVIIISDGMMETRGCRQIDAQLHTHYQRHLERAHYISIEAECGKFPNEANAAIKITAPFVLKEAANVLTSMYVAALPASKRKNLNPALLCMAFGCDEAVLDGPYQSHLLNLMDSNSDWSGWEK